MKKIFAVAAAASLCAALLAGCGSTATASSAASETISQAASAVSEAVEQANTDLLDSAVAAIEAVNPVNNPRTQNPVDSRKLIPAVPHQRIDQRTAVMAGRRMYHHALGFIHHQKLLILIKDIQRNILRKNIRLCQLRNSKKDLILLLYLIICLYRNPIYGNFLVL